MNKIGAGETQLQTVDQLRAPFLQAVDSVDDIVLKKYLLDLDQYEVIPTNENGIAVNLTNDIRLFKINEMVYEKDGFAVDKFATLFSAFSNRKQSIFLLIDSDENDLSLYFGINTNKENISATTIKQAFENTVKSQFPGIKTENVNGTQVKAISDKLLDYKNVASYSGIAFDRVETIRENKDFTQGLEHFLLSMEGKKYTGIILATPIPSSDLESNRKQLESIYTNLSAYKNTQIGYTLNTTENTGTSMTKGTNTGTTSSTTTGASYSEGTSESNGVNQSSKLGAALTVAGGVLALAAGPIGLVVGASMASTGAVMSTKQTTHNTTTSTNQTTNQSDTSGTTYSDTYSKSKTTGYSTGDSKSITVTQENKEITNLLEKIDEQLKRTNTFDNTGAFGCAAYFFSDSSFEAEFAASSYQALVSGEKTMTETNSTNLWTQEDLATDEVKKYLSTFTHPVFKYTKLKNLTTESIDLTPISVVSGRELAIQMGLPRKSVGNFPVVEHAVFGTSILKYSDEHSYRDSIPVGNIFHLGSMKKQQVRLDVESFSMHTFITGATGSGKSNTTYLLLEKLILQGKKFLVIEPAKGEYKHIFGNRKDVSVYGTNSELSELLRINPFYFPKGVHILEHVDRLVEIFNVCWPMYAAMPAILKESVLKSYESVGWDLTTSQFMRETTVYPNFFDVEQQLELVINSSSYSNDSKGDYTGALVTRVHSLTTGLNQFIFSNEDLSDKELFDENVIVDLSRVGSSETKSLIMGLLVMRLNEYRVCQAQELGKINQSLKHVTVLEEAHNLLKRTSQEQSNEGSNLVGKSVEMLSNSIAEMRTYGEGFIIVDQSPTSVDLSAIKNTNTKIIMRTPEFSDRELVGKSVGLNEEQISEIIKLPRGVGVIFQNDWVEPILCSITKSKHEEEMYRYQPKKIMSEVLAQKNILMFLMSKKQKDIIDIAELKISLESFRTNSSLNQRLVELITEFEKNHYITLWNNDNYEELAECIYGISGITDHECFEIVLQYDDDNLVLQAFSRLIEKHVRGLETEFNQQLSKTIFRKHAQTNREFHQLYQLLVEGGQFLL